MSKIFISYRRNDSAYIAGMLAEKLKERFGQNSVFLDIDTIPFGRDIRKHINNAVGQCDILLAIIGDSWLNATDSNMNRRLDIPSDFVRLEIEAALNRNIPVVPVLVGNAELPTEDELPKAINSLAYRNAAELRSGRDLRHHIDFLIDGLQSSPIKKGATERIKKVTTSGKTKKYLAIGATTIAVLVVLAGIYWLPLISQPPLEPDTTFPAHLRGHMMFLETQDKPIVDSLANFFSKSQFRILRIGPDTTEESRYFMTVRYFYQQDSTYAESVKSMANDYLRSIGINKQFRTVLLDAKIDSGHIEIYYHDD